MSEPARGPSPRLVAAAKNALGALAFVLVASGRTPALVGLGVVALLAVAAARRETRSERTLWLVAAAGLFLRALALAPATRRPGGEAVPVADLLLAVACLGAAFGALAIALGRSPVSFATTLVLVCTIGFEALTGVRKGRYPLIAKGVHPVVAMAFDATPAWGGTRDLREREIARPKPPGTFRAVALGASSVWGHSQKTRDRTLVERLEAHLAAKLGRPVEVVCLAQPGYTSFQELANLATIGLDLDPDLVFCMDGYNDMMFLGVTEGRFPGEIWYWPQQRLLFARPLTVALANGSMLFRRVTRPWTDVDWPLYYETALAGPGNARWARDLARNVDAMAVLCRDQGVPFAWTSVPVVYDREPPLAPGETTPAQAGRFFPELERRLVEGRRACAEALRARGVEPIDGPALMTALAKKDGGKTFLFSDDCHYTDAGNDALGRAIVEEAARLGLLGGKR